MPITGKPRALWGVVVTTAAIALPLAGALSACKEAPARGPWTLSGAATRYGRLDHGGIRVVAEPDGPETLTDANGGWILAGAPDGAVGGVSLRFETPGFAPEIRRAWNPGEQSPLVMYRGRNVALPPNLAVVAAEEVPPAGLLLTGEAGDRLLVDLEAGVVGLTLGPDWRPTGGAVDGYVVGVDAVTGEIGGGRPAGTTVTGPGGFTPRGALTSGGERQGVVLSRPLAATPDALTNKDTNQPQEVVYWVPGAEPVPFPDPVLAVGPALRLASGDESITLLVAEGWVHWTPGIEPAPLAAVDAAALPTVTPLFAPQGAGRTLCWAWGPADARAVDCVGVDRPAHTVAMLGEPGGAGSAEADPTPAALVSADPALVVWRDTGAALCRAALADGPTTPEGFPCRPGRVAAHALGDAVVFQDAGGALHRLGPDAYTPLGRGKGLTGEAGVLGYLADDRWLTLLTPDGGRLTAEAPCSPNTSVHVAGAGLLAIDADAKRAVHLAGDGRTGVVALNSADVRAATKPALVSRRDDQIALAGAQGFVRLDLAGAHVFSLVHRGWRFVDFSWPLGAAPETSLPEVALIRARDRVRAIDLYTLASEPLGEGTQAGLLEGRAWFVNDRGLYIVDDPAAE